MKMRHKIQDFITKHDLFEKGFLAIVATIPFGFNGLTNIATAFTVLFSVTLFKKENFISLLKSNRLTMWFIAFFVLLALSLLNTVNLKYGLKVIERSIFFLLFSFIFLVNSNRINKKLIFKSFTVFINFCIIACGICILSALYNTFTYAAVNPFNEVNGNFFAYLKLTQIIKQHPIYFGANLLLAICIIVSEFFKTSKTLSIKYTPVYLTIFLIFIFLLNSFLLLIVLFFIFIFFIVYYLIKRPKKVRIHHLLLFVFAVIVPISYSTSFISHKFNGLNVVEDFITTDFSGNDFTAIKARRAKAYCSIQLIKDNFLFGVGIGDGNDVLKKYYEKYNFQHGIDRKFNSHNQFLTTSIYLGIFGFIILTIIFIELFYTAIKAKNKLLFLFSLITCCFFITESVLERQIGIVYFVFFALLLYSLVKTEYICENE
jgi:O-antigen ligase